MANFMINFFGLRPQRPIHPNPNNNNNNNNQPPPPPATLDPSFLCRLLAAILLALIIVSAVSFLLHIILRPKPPLLRITAASVSPMNTTAAGLTANWNFTVLFTNPNLKLAIYYHRLLVGVYYGDSLLSETEMAPLAQMKKGKTLVDVRLVAVEEALGEEVVKAISEDKRSGVVRFGFRALAIARLTNRDWQLRERLLRVYCDDLHFRFSNTTGDGTLFWPSRNCDVFI